MPLPQRAGHEPEALLLCGAMCWRAAVASARQGGLDGPDRAGGSMSRPKGCRVIRNLYTELQGMLHRAM